MSVLVFFGLVLRLTPIDWGMGLRENEGFYHPDEPKAWRSTADFPENYLTSERYLYGTAVQYGTGLALYPVKKLWQAGYRGPFLGLTYNQLVILTNRAASAFMGAITILLLFLLASDLHDRRTGLIAAGLLSVSPWHVDHSSFATLDVPMGALAVASVLMTCRAFEIGRLRDFIILGLVIGLLTSTKITGALILVVPIVLLLHQIARQSSKLSVSEREPVGEGPSSVHPPRRRPRVPGLMRKLSASAIAALAVFVLSTPHVLLRLPDYLEFMKDQRLTWVASSDHGVWTVVLEWGERSTVLLTPFVAALAGIGILFGRARRERRILEYAILAYLLANVLFWRGAVATRFLLPLVPFLCLYAARVPSLWIGAKTRLVRRAGVLTTIAALSIGTYASVSAVLYRREADTRTLASAHLSEHLRTGATLAMASTGTKNPWIWHRWQYPRIDEKEITLQPILDYPKYVLTTSYALDPIEEALASGHGDLHSPPGPAGGWYRNLAPRPEEFAFFDALLKQESYTLEARWSNPPPVPLAFPAPEIRLYRRRVLATEEPGARYDELE